MKYRFAILLLASAILVTPRALPQGSLTPPGAPSPSMKSLDQLESRTPISSAPYTINASGSYYLTKNLVVASGDAIDINASGVSVDLNGFTITSTSSPASGIAVAIVGQQSNISVRNGIILGSVSLGAGGYSGSGFAHGIRGQANDPINMRVTDISVSGCQISGINIGTNATMVRNCTVNAIGSFGILAHTVIESIATDCGLSAINSKIAVNSAGSITGASSSGIGLYASEVAANSLGESLGAGGTGMNAGVAENVRARAAGGDVAFITQASTNAVATNSGDGDGINATYAVQNSAGTSGGAGYGVRSNTIMNSVGNTDHGNAGILATAVTGSSGTATSGSYGSGINGQVVESSYASGPGGILGYLIQNSQGYASQTFGIFAEYNVANSGGFGPLAGVFCYGPISMSYGVQTGSSNGYGIQSGSVVSYSYGQANVGTGIITSYQAIGDTGNSVQAPAALKFLGTP